MNFLAAYPHDTRDAERSAILNAIGAGEATAKDIACLVGLSHARARQVLAQMVAAGRVKSRPHPSIKYHPRPNVYSRA